MCDEIRAGLRRLAGRPLAARAGVRARRVGLRVHLRVDLRVGLRVGLRACRCG
jgi:hypothetical protein